MALTDPFRRGTRGSGGSRGSRRPAERVMIATMLAVIFVVIIVGSLGYIAGHRDTGPGGGTGAGTPGTSPGGTGGPAGSATTPPGGTAGTPTAGPGGPPTGAAGAGTVPGGGTGPVPSPTTVGDCPAVTGQAAQRAGSPGGLRTVRYALTARSEVWVCRDTAGRLWYQGHLRAYPLTAATSSSSLLLGEVAVEPGGYVATNRGSAGTLTRYHVSRTALVVEFVDTAGRVTGTRTEQILVIGG